MTTTQQNVPVLRFKDEQGNDYPDWEEKTFGDISRVKRGASPRPISSPKWFSENSRIGWVRISDITSSNKYLKKTTQYLSNEGVKKSRFIHKWNIVMSICATIGKPIYTGFDVCIHDGFVVFEGLNVNKEFIYYFLEKMQKRWYRYGQPGTQVNLNSDIVSNEKIRIPKEAEQQKIANFLSAVDTKIEQLNNKKSLWEQYKKGMMQKLFSQEVRFKDEQGKDYPDWDAKILDDVCNIKGGKRIPKGYSLVKGNTGYPYITVSDMKNGTVALGEIKFVPKDVVNKIKNYKISTNDIYVSVAGTLGMVGIVPKELDNANLTENANKLTNIKCNQIYLHQYLLTGKFQKLIDAVKTTNAQPKLAIYALKKFDINLPYDDNEQQKIAAFLSAIDQKIELVTTELKQARTFKKGLLQQMFI